MKRLFLLALGLCLFIPSLSGTTPVKWNKEKLFATPEYELMPRMDTCGVKGVLIRGLEYKGEPAQFFAYYSLPEGADSLHKVPAMVLIHGGLGTAFWEWCKTWNEKGYAAIAMDTNGKLPMKHKNVYNGYHPWIILDKGINLDWGGLDRGLRAPEEQWPYCAVSTVILAHSFLRSLPEVDADRIGVTGNSWGGFLTILTSAVDDRFVFSEPVYACGYLNECFDTKPIEEYTPSEKKWYELWDPALYIPEIKMPVSWAAGTNDFAFAFDPLQRSFDLVNTDLYKAVRLRMVHTDGKFKEGQPNETFALADHFLKGGPDIPKVGLPENIKGNKYSVEYQTSGRKIAGYELLYTKTAEGEWQYREWFAEPLKAPKKEGKISFTIPEGTVAFFVNVITEDELVASSRAIIF